MSKFEDVTCIYPTIISDSLHKVSYCSLLTPLAVDSVLAVVRMHRIINEEMNYIFSMIKKIKSSGCNVLLIQKSILRDAVTGLSFHYLAKAKILVVKDIVRDNIEFITKTMNCLPIANIKHFCAEKLGFAVMVDKGSCGDGKLLKITGINDMGWTTNVLIHVSISGDACKIELSSQRELKNRHAPGEFNAGINVRKGKITYMFEESVVPCENTCDY
nr:T-complex protein 1 subunit delta [Tanacetum cinerariifolium]